MRQQIPEKGRISGTSQIYLLETRGEKDTRFQHNSWEDGYENEARSILHLEPAPSVDLRNRSTHCVHSLIQIMECVG